MTATTRILLVDDEETFVLNLGKLLRFRGFDVATALDGYQALEILDRDAGFDVVVLDVKMPGMDGITTLREIKKRAPEIEAIMLTGHATLQSGIQSIREGAFDYLMKPCDIEDLIEKIKDASNGGRIRHEPVLWRRNLASEISRPFSVKLTVDDPIEKALAALSSRPGLSVGENLYILDGQDRFKGVVTRTDLLDATQKARAGRPVDWASLLQDPGMLPAESLGAIMRAEQLVSAAPGETLTAVAHRMIENNVRCMPVVDGERVQGFILLQDIFYHVEHAIE